MLQIAFTFDKIPAVNNGYYLARGYRTKKKETIEFMRKIQNEFAKYEIDANAKDHFFSLEVFWYNPKFYTKKGLLSKGAGDIDGPLKFIIDALFKGIKHDDSMLKRLTVTQLQAQSPEHKIILNLSLNKLMAL